MFHVLSAAQFSKDEILEILHSASQMEAILEGPGFCELAKGKILAALFYEPSTRTRLSFETAMLRLGGGVISETDVTFSSITKGEVLPDTIRIVSNCADVIAMRSKTKGDAAIAAEYSSVPVLNGGDGSGEHPTQSLLDLYTISKEFDLESAMNVAFIGDMKYGRTVHSLTTMLRHFPNIKLQFIAPDALQIPDSYFQEGDLKQEALSDEIIANADVIYDTRIQKERFEDPAQYEKFKSVYIFDVEQVNKMKDSAILMHPLPRVNEITLAVDDLPQARYFQQAANGIPVRMALIAKALNLSA